MRSSSFLAISRLVGERGSCACSIQVRQVHVISIRTTTSNEKHMHHQKFRGLALYGAFLSLRKGFLWLDCFSCAPLVFLPVHWSKSTSAQAGEVSLTLQSPSSEERDHCGHAFSRSSCVSHLPVHWRELLFFRFRVGHPFFLRPFWIRHIFVDFHQFFLVLLRQRDRVLFRARHRRERSTNVSIREARSKIWRAEGKGTCSCSPPRPITAEEPTDEERPPLRAMEV